MNKLPTLLNEYKISLWAYSYCRDINDDLEVKEFITVSIWAYCYCMDIKDDSEIREYITDLYWAYLYCKNVNMNDERLINLSEKYKRIYKI